VRSPPDWNYALRALSDGNALASLIFGWLIGGSLLLIILLGLGMVSGSCGRCLQGGLTDLVSTGSEHLLGLQSALGFGVSVISPQILADLDATNAGKSITKRPGIHSSCLWTYRRVSPVAALRVRAVLMAGLSSQNLLLIGPKPGKSQQKKNNKRYIIRSVY
jgi:hypothetical protein